jgi:effector-binding domain-containing protein
MTLASTLGLACSVVGIRTTKEPEYRVVLADGNREIREYAAYLVARTEVRGEYDASGSEAFRRLFDYISGNNVNSREISMTSPVLQEPEGTEIAMTAPVMQHREEEVWWMDFVMPAHFTRETTPQPQDERVKIVEIPAQTVAVIRYSGLVSTDEMLKKAQELEKWLSNQPYRSISRARSARYDPPFTLPFFRRNEVHLVVESIN